MPLDARVMQIWKSDEGYMQDQTSLAMMLRVRRVLLRQTYDLAGKI